MKVRTTVVIGSILLALVSGCSDKPEQGGQESKPELKQSIKPSLDLEKTKVFFSMVSAKTLGKVHGKVELREDGILVHPGETPTKAVFNLKKFEPTFTIAASIATLPPETLALSNTGLVGFELFLDGKSLGRKTVDRFTNYVEKINTENAKTLTVVVDNGNGEPWADWLILGIQ